MVKWEYTSILIQPDEMKQGDTRLNQYGKEGWELVSVVLSDGGSSSMKDGLLFFFKKQKQVQESD